MFLKYFYTFFCNDSLNDGVIALFSCSESDKKRKSSEMHSKSAKIWCFLMWNQQIVLRKKDATA